MSCLMNNLSKNAAVAESKLRKLMAVPTKSAFNDARSCNNYWYSSLLLKLHSGSSSQVYGTKDTDWCTTCVDLHALSHSMGTTYHRNQSRAVSIPENGARSLIHVGEPFRYVASGNNVRTSYIIDLLPEVMIKVCASLRLMKAKATVPASKASWEP